MLQEVFRKVCVWIKKAGALPKVKIPAFLHRPESLIPEHCPVVKDNLASGARCTMNPVSLWRLLRGNIPNFTLFTFFPDRT